MKNPLAIFRRPSTPARSFDVQTVVEDAAREVAAQFADVVVFDRAAAQAQILRALELRWSAMRGQVETVKEQLRAAETDLDHLDCPEAIRAHAFDEVRS